MHRSGPRSLLWSSDAAVFLETFPYIMQDTPGARRLFGEQLSFFLLSQHLWQQTQENGKRKRERITVKSTVTPWTETGTLEKSHTSFLKRIRHILQKMERGGENFSQTPASVVSYEHQ